MANGRNVCSALLAAILIFGAWAWYANAAAPELFGPIECPACSLETPNPGIATKTFLEAWAWDVRHTYWAPNQMVVDVNDKVMVCNGTICVTYTLTDSGQYFGGKPERQTTNSSGGVGSGSGQGGGQGVGRGGGADAGAGSYGGGRTGSVTVGGPQPIRRPTNED